MFNQAQMKVQPFNKSSDVYTYIHSYISKGFGILKELIIPFGVVHRICYCHSKTKYATVILKQNFQATHLYIIHNITYCTYTETKLCFAFVVTKAHCSYKYHTTHICSNNPCTIGLKH